MSGINTGRVLVGGLVAGIIVWIIEGVASVFYMDDMQAAMQAHNLSMDMGSGAFALTVLISLIAGLALVFFYAVARPRFGPGPRTAAIVAVALWFGGYLISLLGYFMLGLFPTGMLFTWGLIGLFELILAAVGGAYFYRES